jgi:hypothetical protein
MGCGQTKANESQVSYWGKKVIFSWYSYNIASTVQFLYC